MKLAIYALAAVAAIAIGADPSSAKPQTFAEAKKAGIPVTNCQYCHTTAVPKKETFKPEELNDRGKLLWDDMKARNLKTPDVEKLKDYKER